MPIVYQQNNQLNLRGVFLCSRYSYPPNSLSLCGPNKKNDLAWYSTRGKADAGNVQILTQFSTLYPYLSFIARQNNIKNPFDPRVVEAYWLGNKLLDNISPSPFARHLNDGLGLAKRLKRKSLQSLFAKITHGAIPQHSFHVLNIYRRTGHIDSSHTLGTMDACLVNWGQIIEINKDSLLVKTQALKFEKNKLIFSPPLVRPVMSQGGPDVLFAKLNIGDYISYHWSYFCQKLAPLQLLNLSYYTKISLGLANNFL